MRILVFDNYDSFTYNLVHLVQQITHGKVEVHRNDQIPMEKIRGYDKIILSPGPGIPSEAGSLLTVINEYASSKSILGVCLGHQAIGEAFGGRLVNLENVYHGVATNIQVGSRESGVGSRESGVGSRELGVGSRELGVGSRELGVGSRESGVGSRESRVGSKDLFKGLPEKIMVGRYHSWIISDEGFPEELEITARDDNGYIMALRHKNFDLQGVQFHPESVLTPDGKKIMENWLND